MYRSGESRVRLPGADPGSGPYSPYNLLRLSAPVPLLNEDDQRTYVKGWFLGLNEFIYVLLECLTYIKLAVPFAIIIIVINTLS